MAVQFKPVLTQDNPPTAPNTFSTSPSSAPVSSPSGSPGGSGSGSSGSGVPVIHSNAPAVKFNNSVSFEMELVTTAAQNPAPFPAYRVPRGSTVEIWPIPTNTQNVYTGIGPSQVKAGLRKTIPAGAVVAFSYRVEVLNELWLFSNVVGEGVIIRVTR